MLRKIQMNSDIKTAEKQAVKALLEAKKNQFDALDFAQQIVLKKLLKKYPKLIEAINMNAFTLQMILDIKEKKGIKNFVENIKVGFLETFGNTWAVLQPERLIKVAMLGKEKFLQLQAFFANAILLGNESIAQHYTNALYKLTDEQFSKVLNTNSSILSLTFINKSHRLDQALKVEEMMNDQKEPLGKRQAYANFAATLGDTKKYIVAKLDKALSYADKIDHWYVWNGRAKAKAIRTEAQHINKLFLGSNAPAVFDVTTVFDIKVNSGKSLNEVLSTGRHGIFSRKSKTTASKQLFDEVPMPVLKK